MISTPATSEAGNSGSFAGSRFSPAAASVPRARSKASFTSGSAPFTVKSCGMIAPRSEPGARVRPRAKLAGSAELEGSAGSCPAIASSTIRQSDAARVIGPTLSKVQAHTIAPARLTRP